MTRSAYIYVAAVVIGAIGLIIAVPFADVLLLTARDYLGLVTFALVAVASNLTPSTGNISIGKSNDARTSMAFLPLFAAAILFPPAALLLIVILVEIADEMTHRSDSGWTPFFNTAVSVISYGLAALFFWVVLSRMDDALARYGDYQLLARIGAMLVFVGTFYLVHLTLVGSYFALRGDSSLLRVIQRATGPGGSNLFYDVLAAPIAFITALLYEQLYIAGVLLIVFPLLLIRYSYISRLQLQDANRNLLRVLIKAIETRDPYTSGHSVRVSTLAKTIAEDLDLHPRLVDKVETAGLLHDIGKIDAVYAGIIRKDSGLSAEERDVIRTHAVRGADLLRSLTSLDKVVIDGVRHHHERFDGTGYPDGLAGKEIPVTARIIMLCDAIDAMLSDRPYRKALDLQRVRMELVENSGTQFDPNIVEQIIERGTLRRASELVGPVPTHRRSGTPVLQRA